MQATFFLGPAGSGKTHRCLTDIRQALTASPEGPPLLFLAPKQATFQLERQLLGEDDLPGYARLHILSFERLAEFTFNRLQRPVPPLLDEQGRVMVLRALLTRHREALAVFHASARWPGFARHLSQLIRECQHHDLSSARLDELARRTGVGTPLGRKLRDLAQLTRAYQEWLAAQRIQDGDHLLRLAATAIREHVPGSAARTALHCGGLWLDGFAEMTPQELGLLAALLPHCDRATLAFCLDHEPSAGESWLSPWTVVGQTCNRCRLAVNQLPGVQVTTELLPRHPAHNRFVGHPVLQHLERHWSAPRPFEAVGQQASEAAHGARQLAVADPASGSPPPASALSTPPATLQQPPSTLPSLRLVACPHPEAEAVFAAREILRRTREPGGRFRDCAVLVRSLTDYHDALRRVFSRYHIPFFLDRREPVAHHPLAELVRYALRTVAFGWQADDWFGALKTGLVPAEAGELDRLENAALAHGWEGAAWRQPLRLGHQPAPDHLEATRQRVVPPFVRFAEAVATANGQPSGSQLADALRTLWEDLEVGRRLRRWSEAAMDRPPTAPSHPPSPVADRPGEPTTPRIPADTLHQTVWDQLQGWLANLERAFPTEALPLREWLAIIEAGLGGLTVGVIPPALDQVLMGAIDRSRNPDLRHVFVLGLNERVFPAPPPRPVLLTDAERDRLLAEGHLLGATRQQQLGHERYFGYIACTRARESVTLTWAARDAQGGTLNPSAFVHHLQRLFPDVQPEPFSVPAGLNDVQHAEELVTPLIQAQPALAAAMAPAGLTALATLPAYQSVLAKAAQVPRANQPLVLATASARALFGTELSVSVSALEDFAACPFKFFAGRGLRAREREEFAVDPRERGLFQHEVLKWFHQRVQSQGRQWRYVEPVEAQVMVQHIGQDLVDAYREGLFAASAERQFQAGLLIDNLVRLVGTLVEWNRSRYDFDPRYVELSFGIEHDALPAWRIPLDAGRGLLLRGRMDRVDVCFPADSDDALVTVMDYKSSEQRLDATRLHHGLDLQLLSYLCRLAQGDFESRWFGAARVVPAGAFYINLRGTARAAATRTAALQQSPDEQARVFQHRGRFDDEYRRYFDRAGETKGVQFAYEIKQDGTPSQRSEGLAPDDFQTLLAQTTTHVQRLGNAIFSGAVNPAPYRLGAEIACDQCEFRCVCRFDPWVQSYRVLRPPPKPEPAPPESATASAAAQPKRARRPPPPTS